MKILIALMFLCLACSSSNSSSLSLEKRQEAAQDECWKSLSHKLAQELHTVRWINEQGYDITFVDADNLFPDLVEISISQWGLKGYHAKIETDYGGWKRIEYTCIYNPIATEVISICYSDRAGTCR